MNHLECQNLKLLKLVSKEYDIYNKYRNLIYEGKYRVEELDQVVLHDEKLNRRLLFEILLRRTVAAKWIIE